MLPSKSSERIFTHRITGGTGRGAQDPGTHRLLYICYRMPYINLSPWVSLPCPSRNPNSAPPSGKAVMNRAETWTPLGTGTTCWLCSSSNTYRTNMDAEITAPESRRDKTHALKQGMMQELRTDRIRLPIARHRSVSDRTAPTVKMRQ